MITATELVTQLRSHGIVASHEADDAWDNPCVSIFSFADGTDAKSDVFVQLDSKSEGAWAMRGIWVWAYTPGSEWPEIQTHEQASNVADVVRILARVARTHKTAKTLREKDAFYR